MADPRFAPTEQCHSEHCRHSTESPAPPSLWRYAPAVPAARTGGDRVRSRGRAELDEVSDDEAWLWRLVEEADRVVEAAPAVPDRDRLAAAEQTLAQAMAFEERIQLQIRTAHGALARPSSWLRPAYRGALARQLRRDRATAVMAAIKRSRAADAVDRLRSLAAARAAYLAEHKITIAAGRNARRELLAVIDDLIEGYAGLSDPPAWFRFGLGTPGSTPDWLQTAREAVAARRRTTMEAQATRVPD